MYRKFISVPISLLFALGATTAIAGQFSQNDIGQSIPYWVDALATVNNSGEVAWTKMNTAENGGEARFYSVGTGSVALPTNGSAISYAGDITDSGWIAGYASSTPRLLDQRALVWVKSGTSSFTIRELDSAFPVNAIPQQSAARGINASASPGSYTVAGSARAKVNHTTFPQPVVWTVSASSVDVQKLALPSGEGQGIAVGVGAVDGSGAQWVCGQTATTSTYAHATCWDLNSVYNPAVGPSAHQIPALSGAATSMVNRVRTVPVGPSQTLQTFVVGSALSTGGDWSGWVYNLTTNEFWEDLGLVSDGDSFAFDVKSIVYPEVGTGFAQGLMVAGYAATTAPQSLQASHGPKGVPTAPLRGVVHRQLLFGVTDAGRVCDVNDETEQIPGHYHQIVSMSTNGEYRLARAGGTLRLLTNQASTRTITLHQRDTRVRLTADQTSAGVVPGTATPIVRAQVEATSSADSAKLVLGSRVACDGSTGPGTSGVGTCEPGTEATFDIGGDEGLNARTLLLSPVVGQANRLRSAMLNNVRINTPPLKFAQLAEKSGGVNSCSITPVFEPVVVLNPQTDFDGKVWHDCHGNIAGYDTDAQISYDHCGQCNRTANDGLSCTSNTCVAGTRRSHKIPEASATQCWVNGDGSWQSGQCVANGALEVSTNPCKACVPSSNSADWSAVDYRTPFYRCIAHHSSAGYPNRNPHVDWAFWSGSDKVSNGSPYADFKLDDYGTNHLCANAKWQNDDTKTRNVNNSAYWEHVSNPQSLAAPVWPTTFFNMTHRSNKPNEYSNTMETRSWLFGQRIRYLGQLNSENRKGFDQANQFYPALDAVQFSLPPGSDEEWFAIYYNDKNGGQDKIATTVQFDGTQMQLEVELYFVCAGDGHGGRPRLDGIRNCGPADDGPLVYETTCQLNEVSSLSKRSNGSGNPVRRTNSCRATGYSPTVAGPYPDAAHAGGVYIEGLLDCGKKPSDSSADRDGWAFVRVKRLSAPGKNDPLMCSQIQLSFWRWADTGNVMDACW